MKTRTRQDEVQRAADKVAMSLPARYAVVVAFEPGDPADRLNRGQVNVGAHTPTRALAIQLLREAAATLEAQGD